VPQIAGWSRTLLLAVVFGTALIAAWIATPRIANAYIFHFTAQKDAYLAQSGYYMHQWLIHEYDYTSTGTLYYDHWYRNGMDSRWSWGGAGRNMYALGMVPARAWKCGALYWSRNAYLYNTYYHYADSPHTGWTTCGGQADFNGRFYQPGVVDWWTYLNY